MTKTARRANITIRNTREDDFAGIIEMARLIYPNAVPWSIEQLLSHRRTFAEGQWVAVEEPGNTIVGMAASLIVDWDEYEFDASWRDFTANGFFTNHNPQTGRTLYGADVMVHPHRQRCGIGHKLYEARRTLCRDLGLRRIRAGARLRNYAAHAPRMGPAEYVQHVVAGELKDPTLSFQLREGFRVIGVVANYIINDPESLGYAAIIEWINRQVARPADYSGRAQIFGPAGARRALRDSHGDPARATPSATSDK